MEIEGFDYDIPEGLIADGPEKERDGSRLMVIDKGAGAISHRAFPHIMEYLKRGDVLVLNDTRVMQARLFGRKKTGGRVEVMLVEECFGPGEKGLWQCMLRPAKGISKGSTIFFDEGIEAEVTGVDRQGFRLCAFKGSSPEAIMERQGSMPLPPYIRRPANAQDTERYQTVFAEKTGAVAAPTAGLHFTKRLIQDIIGTGVQVLYITLHTGPGTFMPVREKDITRHKLLPERYSISPDTFNAAVSAKKQGRRIIAAGTTVTRALEASALNGFDRPALQGKTGLFIYPGYEFKVIDRLLTNFHLPRSTLIMLAAAFTGHELLMNGYKEAIKQKYRFYSYGDAMLII
ncbi:MAG: tRNA preQ1(34) S-adenosylmethionine ribosyltransferase-isomerase QueA [Deltaproteobacteria bacterium]|nr:tRNA preQ1(34) S-adenosylmethionine ribosyltransferase-isomerase QueA [Deltaproteobacteria bacterium]